MTALIPQRAALTPQGCFFMYGANSTFTLESLVPDVASWRLSRLKRESGSKPELSPQLYVSAQTGSICIATAPYGWEGQNRRDEPGDLPMTIRCLGVRRKRPSRVPCCTLFYVES